MYNHTSRFITDLSCYGYFPAFANPLTTLSKSDSIGCVLLKISYSDMLSQLPAYGKHAHYPLKYHIYGTQGTRSRFSKILPL